MHHTIGVIHKKSTHKFKKWLSKSLYKPDEHLTLKTISTSCFKLKPQTQEETCQLNPSCLFCVFWLSYEVSLFMLTSLTLPAKVEQKVWVRERVRKDIKGEKKKKRSNTITLSISFGRETKQSRKILQRSFDTDFFCPRRGFAVVGHRVSGCWRRYFLLLLLSFVPFSLCGGPRFAHPRRMFQTWLRGERFLQNLENPLDLQHSKEVRAC